VQFYNVWPIEYELRGMALLEKLVIVELVIFLLSLKVHYHVIKVPPLDPVLAEINSVHAF
jgi:hypothetical protein